MIKLVFKIVRFCLLLISCYVAGLQPRLVPIEQNEKEINDICQHVSGLKMESNDTENVLCEVVEGVTFDFNGICGLAGIDGKNLGFQTQESDVYLENHNSKLLKTESQWEIWNTDKNKIVATMNETSGFPLGTWNWNFLDSKCMDEDKNTRRLNLHLKVTQPGHFCCENGACIDSKFVCDGNSQCPHREDEIGCNYITLMKGYSNNPPETLYENQVISNFSIYFSHIIV